MFVNHSRVARQVHAIVCNADIADEDVPVLTDVDVVIEAFACKLYFPVFLSATPCGLKSIHLDKAQQEKCYARPNVSGSVFQNVRV